MERVTVRPMRAADAEAAARVFFAAVRDGAAGHYDAAQRRAWAPEVPAPKDWRARLADRWGVVAEAPDAADKLAVVGFMTLRADGCIDLAFVAPAAIGQGVAGRLYDAVEAEARRRGLERLWAEASRMARPLFERRGWRVVRPQTVERGEVTLENFVMEKVLEG